jgi:DNA-binding SARP family transcriptional activator/tetratricopeptide (TPR) repeat protein
LTQATNKKLAQHSITGTPLDGHTFLLHDTPSPHVRDLGSDASISRRASAGSPSHASARMTVDLVTLGPVRCVIDGTQNADLPNQRLRFALLVYLAVERRATRETVLSIFWPDKDPERGRHTLSQTLYELRRGLGEGWLSADGDQLSVTDAVQIDAVEFERRVKAGNAAGALELYHGGFLDGFYLPTKGFESWVDRQRSRLARLHRDCRREHVNALASSDVKGAIAASRAWVEVDQLDDEANHRLIELLALAGLRSDALQEYEAYEKRLEADLDVEPLDETKALIAQIRDGEIGTSRTELKRTPAPAPANVAAVRSSGSSETSTEATTRRAPKLVGIILLTAALVGLASLIMSGRWRGAFGPGATAGETNDSTKFVVLPFNQKDVQTLNADPSTLLRESMRKWTGIEIIDAFRVTGELAGRDPATLSTAEAGSLARRLGAGRYVRGEIARVGDSISYHLTAYDATRNDKVVGEATGRSERLARNFDHVFSQLAEELLFGSMATDSAARLTRSYPARSAFNRGERALREWNLEQAIREFQSATVFDPQYTLAHLRLAQARNWAGDDPGFWSADVESVSSRVNVLADGDRRLSSALLKLARRDYPGACREYADLIRMDESSFAAWFGIAECNRLDAIVLNDPLSPSKHSFRSSRWQAVQAYRRAFEILPSITGTFPEYAYFRVETLLTTEVRVGRTLAGDTMYIARPTIQRDTIAFIPFSSNDVAAVQPWTQRSGVRTEARRMLNEIASGWAKVLPGNAEALAALASSLDLLGDPTALDTLRRARALAKTTAQKQHLAAFEILLEVKNSLPDDTELLVRAMATADSLLADSTLAGRVTWRDAALMASIAALSGRAQQTAIFASRALSGSGLQVATPAIRPAETLLTYASLGMPDEFMRPVVASVETSIQNSVPPQRWDTTRFELYDRAARISFPSRAIERGAWTGVQKDYLLEAQAAFERHDYVSIHRIFDKLAYDRRFSRPADIKTDGLFPEAVLLRMMGANRDAIRWLDPTLADLRWSAPRTFSEFPRAATLVRAMALRAELAAEAGDTQTARKWARAVRILWSSADAPLMPVVERMQTLAR